MRCRIGLPSLHRTRPVLPALPAWRPCWTCRAPPRGNSAPPAWPGPGPDWPGAGRRREGRRPARPRWGQASWPWPPCFDTAPVVPDPPGSGPGALAHRAWCRVNPAWICRSPGLAPPLRPGPASCPGWSLLLARLGLGDGGRLRGWPRPVRPAGRRRPAGLAVLAGDSVLNPVLRPGTGWLARPDRSKRGRWRSTGAP